MRGRIDVLLRAWGSRDDGTASSPQAIPEENSRTRLDHTSDGQARPAGSTGTDALGQSADNDSRRIYIYDLTTRTHTAVTEGPHDFYPDFSPDGTRIVFMRVDATNYRQLYIKDLRTGAVRALTRDNLQHFSPAWRR